MHIHDITDHTVEACVFTIREYAFSVYGSRYTHTIMPQDVKQCTCEYLTKAVPTAWMCVHNCTHGMKRIQC